MAKKVQIVQPDLSGNDNTVTTVTTRLVKGGARTSNKAPQQMKSVRITISISPEVESKLNALLTIAKYAFMEWWIEQSIEEYITYSILERML